MHSIWRHVALEASGGLDGVLFERVILSRSGVVGIS
jgi:hypothetical protein